MAKVLSSISGNLISAASAGYAPTNGADVSAIASAYQVVSATGTQLYAGTAYVTSLNSAPLSASRAGNAANASMANSAYYDGTGRLISALPDSATVSAIASSYAASAASSKQDSSAMSSYALSADVSSTISAVSTNSASWASTIETASSTAYKQNGTQLVTFTGVASADTKPLIAQTIQAGAVQSIGTSNFFYGPSAKPFTANTAGIYAPLQYATGACLAMDGGTYRAYYKGNEWFISDYGTNRSGAVRAEVHNTRGIHISGSNTAGIGFDLLTSGLNFTDNTGTTSMTPANIAEWKSCNNTVSANSATWASASAISSYALSADVSSTIDTVSAQSANWGGSALAMSAGLGVSLTKTGDTLVVSNDDVVLWSGTATNITDITLSEAYTNFDRLRFYWKPWTDDAAWHVSEIPAFTPYFTLDAGWASTNGSTRALFIYGISSEDNLTFSQVQGGYQNITGNTAWNNANACTVVKVVGVNRTAGV